MLEFFLGVLCACGSVFCVAATALIVAFIAATIKEYFL